MGRVAQHAEPVREPVRHVQLPVVLTAQLHTVPATERRGAAAQVDGDIEDLTAQAGHELALRIG